MTPCRHSIICTCNSLLADTKVLSSSQDSWAPIASTTIPVTPNHFIFVWASTHQAPTGFSVLVWDECNACETAGARMRHNRQRSRNSDARKQTRLVSRSNIYNDCSALYSMSSILYLIFRKFKEWDLILAFLLLNTLVTLSCVTLLRNTILIMKDVALLYVTCVILIVIPKVFRPWGPITCLVSHI